MMPRQRDTVDQVLSGAEEIALRIAVGHDTLVHLKDECLRPTASLAQQELAASLPAFVLR
jgi:hypothetical protein